MKLKPILPSLKEKKRYLSFEIISDSSFSADEVSKAVNEGISNFMGTLETGKAGIIFFNDKYSNNSGIIKVGHKHVDKARASLILIKSINGKEAIVRTRVVSGTLKKSMSKFNEMKKMEAEI